MSAETLQKIFWGRTLVIATMHGKETVLAPLLEESLWVSCILPQWFDSDRFWTFSGEAERTWNQLEAARMKLLHALDISWESLWVATEGSFWPDPQIPFLHSHRELVILIDTKNNFEILWHFQSFETNLAGEYVETEEEIDAFLKKIWFPEHGVILRKKSGSLSGIEKNISSKQELSEAIKKLQKTSFFSKKIYLETDMRAMHNPTRMKWIEAACKNLLENMKSFCPQCVSPWYVVTEIIPWLPCEWCMRPTGLALTEIYTCASCKHREERRSEKYGRYADPGNCSHCNP